MGKKKFFLIFFYIVASALNSFFGKKNISEKPVLEVRGREQTTVGYTVVSFYPLKRNPYTLKKNLSLLTDPVLFLAEILV